MKQTTEFTGRVIFYDSFTKTGPFYHDARIVLGHLYVSGTIGQAENGKFYGSYSDFELEFFVALSEKRQGKIIPVFKHSVTTYLLNSKGYYT